MRSQDPKPDEQYRIVTGFLLFSKKLPEIQEDSYGRKIAVGVSKWLERASWVEHWINPWWNIRWATDEEIKTGIVNPSLPLC